MDSSHQQHQNHQPNSGLLRYRSAPSSLFVNFNDNNKNSFSMEGSESERLFSGFVNYSGSNGSESCPPSFRDLDDKSSVMGGGQQNQRYNNSGLPPHYPRQSSNMSSSVLDNGSFGLMGSMAMDTHNTQPNKSLNSNLLRQSSSPAGLFSHISLPNGYATIKGSGNYGGLNNNNNSNGTASQGEMSPPTNRLKSQLSFSPRIPSLGMLSQISEVESENNLEANTLDEENKLGNNNENNTSDVQFYGSGFSFGSWNDSSNFSDSYGGLRRDQDKNNEEMGNRIQFLSHHLSLPKSSAAEISMEKFLHFQDAVPCKVRAKRGCATHPRSIAERVRRTRISERMRKLQELVPNMDKQTNTADMLDLAVEYIKDLQKQFKTLSDKRANCKCLNMQKAIPNQVI
ncbi:hypothetical protein CsatB_016496 [Cannabis sativa]